MPLRRTQVEEKRVAYVRMAQQGGEDADHVANAAKRPPCDAARLVMAEEGSATL